MRANPLHSICTYSALVQPFEGAPHRRDFPSQAENAIIALSLVAEGFYAYVYTYDCAYDSCLVEVTRTSRCRTVAPRCSHHVMQSTNRIERA